MATKGKARERQVRGRANRWLRMLLNVLRRRGRSMRVFFAELRKGSDRRWSHNAEIDGVAAAMVIGIVTNRIDAQARVQRALRDRASFVVRMSPSPSCSENQLDGMPCGTDFFGDLFMRPTRQAPAEDRPVPLLRRVLINL